MEMFNSTLSAVCEEASSCFECIDNSCLWDVTNKACVFNLDALRAAAFNSTTMFSEVHQCPLDNLNAFYLSVILTAALLIVGLVTCFVLFCITCFFKSLSFERKCPRCNNTHHPSVCCYYKPQPSPNESAPILRFKSPNVTFSTINDSNLMKPCPEKDIEQGAKQVEQEQETQDHRRFVRLWFSYFVIPAVIIIPFYWMMIFIFWGQNWPLLRDVGLFIEIGLGVFSFCIACAWCCCVGATKYAQSE
eukprot:TRINITY_DN1823_c0_g1_i2.p1 TRINITY_DN1823_c0_g1~~TRINITY_DN1823_c0_g1_i2.p1  ORF type:complete len:247 (+),score=32.06 TRINITY_DN1823_c0_g1_i2:737-1477(+)